MAQADLSGARVLIVEDEYYLADDLSRALREAGAQVVGPVGSLPEAQAAVDERSFDCAVLDMNLRGEAAFPIADRLGKAGIPFVIATGYNSIALPERFRGLPRVEKPFDMRQLLEAIPALMNGRG
jgi:DNA-binding response OmpR family regulator